MPSIYRCDDLTLDTGRHALQRNGVQLDLPPLSYRLLLCLIRAAPNVLSHEEIADQVWEGRFTSPETLTQRVKLLRHALGDDAAHPRYIRVVRGAGYQLIPVVRPAPPLEQLNHVTRRRVLVSTMTGIVSLAAIVFLLGSRQLGVGVSIKRSSGPS